MPPCPRLMLTLAAASHLGCAAGEAPDSSSTVRDSAGVVIVESTRGAWESGDAWTISREPVLDIGQVDGSPEYQLYRAWSAVRLSDGRVVIANGGTNELRFHDASGTHLASVGRSGEGPGEFEDLQRVWRLAGDTLLAYDFFPARLSLFSSSGAFIRSQRFASPDGRQIMIRGRFSDGSIVAAGAPIWNPPGATSGVLRDSVPYYLFDSTATLIRTIGYFPSSEVYRIVEGGGWRLTSVPFARVPVAAVAGNTLYFGPATTYEIQAFGSSGDLERILRLEQPPRSVTSDDVSQFRNERLERAESEGTRPSMERILRELPFPETLPPYDQVVADTEGNLWIADYRTDRSNGATWRVLSADGVFLGTVRTPAQYEVFQIGSDFILGSWTDELGVEHIRMYALIKPPRP